MKIYDVTLELGPNLPIWPGDPAFKLERVLRMEDGADANVSQLSMSVHAGTHVDAPLHFLADGNSVGQLSLEILTGPALVLEIPSKIGTIDASDLPDFPAGTERLLLKTGNSINNLYSRSEFQTNFTAVSESGAREIVRRGVKLVGIDYLSIAPFDDPLPAHQVCLSSDLVVVEGLDLRNVPSGMYDLYSLPLKLVDSEGAPARVILVAP